MIDYSTDEIKLFVKIGFFSYNSFTNYRLAYREAVWVSFIQNQKGPHIDTLQKVCNFLFREAGLRNSDKFKQLIRFKD